MLLLIFLFDWLEVTSWSQHNYKSGLVTAPARLWSRRWLSPSPLPTTPSLEIYLLQIQASASRLQLNRQRREGNSTFLQTFGAAQYWSFQYQLNNSPLYEPSLYCQRRSDDNLSWDFINRAYFSSLIWFIQVGNLWRRKSFSINLSRRRRKLEFSIEKKSFRLSPYLTPWEKLKINRYYSERLNRLFIYFSNFWNQCF